MADWSYGDSWEKFPIEENQIWSETNSNSFLSVSDIIKEVPDFMNNADMIYTDPPWNIGMVKSFYTKAQINEAFSFDDFSKALFTRISESKAKICYLEIGKQHFNQFESELKKLFPIVQSWDIFYSKDSPMKLLRGGQTPQEFDFTGLNDTKTPLIAMQHEEFNSVADYCIGRGLTAVSAHKLCKTFYGTELNKRRLAVTIDKITKKGGNWKKI